jgi:hypothetical protein
MKRSYEENTRIEFDRLMRTIFPDASIVWEDVPEHVDPPDWYLELDNIRYAVEATSIVGLLPITLNRKIPTTNVSMTLYTFIKNVEKSARDQEILSGAYVVMLGPMPNFSENREKLSNDLLTYIRETRSFESASVCTLGFVRHQRIWIKKEHNNKNYVTAAISMGGMRGADAQEELSQLVSRTLSQKTHKLRRVSEPIILLVLDEYHYSFLADWTKVISACPDRFHFYCICRISPADGNSILWTKTSGWKAITTG